MAFTGVLGTADSRLGNIVLGLVSGSAPVVDGLAWLRRPKREVEPAEEVAPIRLRSWLTTVFPPPFVEQMGWRRRPYASEEQAPEPLVVRRQGWLGSAPDRLKWLRRPESLSSSPAIWQSEPRRFPWDAPSSPGLGGEWIVRPRRVFPEPVLWEWPPRPPLGWLPYVVPAPPPAPACPYRPGRPDQGQALARRPDEVQSRAGRPNESETRSNRPDESGSRPGRPDECR
jgi:hypothetical protein